MKKIVLLISISLLTFGCNMNPNKEARIQQLESEIMQTLERIEKIEERVEILESENAVLESRIIELEFDKNSEE